MTEAELDNITRVRDLSLQLRRCAQAGEWDAVVDIEANRRPLLYRVFDKSALGIHGQYRELLKEILEVDREIMALALQRQSELAEWLHQAGQGRAALKAYGKNAR